MDRWMTYNGSHALGRPTRHRRLFHNNLAVQSSIGDDTTGSFDLFQICCSTFAESVFLGRSVDAQEDDVGSANGIIDSIRAHEEEVCLALSVSTADVSVAIMATGRRLASKRGAGGAGEASHPTTSDTNNLLQTRLVDGERVGIPCVNTCLIKIDDTDRDFGVLVGNHSAIGAADVSCANAADVGDVRRQSGARVTASGCFGARKKWTKVIVRAVGLGGGIGKILVVWVTVTSEDVSETLANGRRHGYSWSYEDQDQILVYGVCWCVGVFGKTGCVL